MPDWLGFLLCLWSLNRWVLSHSYPLCVAATFLWLSHSVTDERGIQINAPRSPKLSPPPPSPSLPSPVSLHPWLCSPPQGRPKTFVLSDTGAILVDKTWPLRPSAPGALGASLSKVSSLGCISNRLNWGQMNKLCHSETCWSAFCATFVGSKRCLEEKKRWDCWVRNLWMAVFKTPFFSF